MSVMLPLFHQYTKGCMNPLLLCERTKAELYGRFLFLQTNQSCLLWHQARDAASDSVCARSGGEASVLKWRHHCNKRLHETMKDKEKKKQIWTLHHSALASLSGMQSEEINIIKTTESITSHIYTHGWLRWQWEGGKLERQKFKKHSKSQKR